MMKTLYYFIYVIYLCYLFYKIKLFLIYSGIIVIKNGNKI